MGPSASTRAPRPPRRGHSLLSANTPTELPLQSPGWESGLKKTPQWLPLALPCPSPEGQTCQKVPGIQPAASARGHPVGVWRESPQFVSTACP